LTKDRHRAGKGGPVDSRLYERGESGSCRERGGCASTNTSAEGIQKGLKKLRGHREPGGAARGAVFAQTIKWGWVMIEGWREKGGRDIHP